MKLFTTLLFLLPFQVFGQHNFEKEKAELLSLHHQLRDFHFQKLTEEFAECLSENVIMVNRGKVSTPSRAENIERWTNYFNAVEFLEWDDIEVPQIRFSKDGSMAYVIVQKRVRLNYEGEAGKIIEESTDFAWVSIYEKINDEWKTTCNVSTNQPTIYRVPNITEDLEDAGLELLETLEMFDQAYRNGDMETLAGLLTEKYIHSNNGGEILRKSDWLGWVATRKELIENNELNYSDYYNENVTIEIYGDAAVVHGTNISKGLENGKSFHKKIAFTHTWIKEEGNWRRASFHDSRIKE